MSAFDPINRSDLEPASLAISGFDYLNKSARPEAQAAREFVDQMLDRYPTEYRESLIRRFRLSDEISHRAAFFELFLHDLCLRSGCKILAVEPKIEGNSRSPDFLVKSPSGAEFYLEATTATGESRENAGATKRLNAVLNAVDSVDSSDFFLAIRHRGVPSKPVPLGRLRKKIEKWLANLDPPSTVADTGCGRQAYPALSHSEYGLTLVIEAFPRTRPVQASSRRGAVGTISPGGKWVTIQNSIKKVIEKKADKYKNLKLPFVVAVNTLQYSRRRHFLDALFGAEVFKIPTKDIEAEEECSRKPNGLWRNTNGPDNRGVSAVIGVNSLCPWSFAQRGCTFIPNPWASHPIELVCLRIDRYLGQGDALAFAEGSPPYEIFVTPQEVRTRQ